MSVMCCWNSQGLAKGINMKLFFGMSFIRREGRGSRDGLQRGRVLEDIKHHIVDSLPSQSREELH